MRVAWRETKVCNTPTHTRNFSQKPWSLKENYFFLTPPQLNDGLSQLILVRPQPRPSVAALASTSDFNPSLFRLQNELRNCFHIRTADHIVHKSSPPLCSDAFHTCVPRLKRPRLTLIFDTTQISEAIIPASFDSDALSVDCFSFTRSTSQNSLNW